MNDEWNRCIVNKPNENERQLISDGEIMCVAQFIDNHWIFDNPNMTDVVVLYWRKLPKFPPKIEVISAEK